jgi:hypothetical protein
LITILGVNSFTGVVRSFSNFASNYRRATLATPDFTILGSELLKLCDSCCFVLKYGVYRLSTHKYDYSIKKGPAGSQRTSGTISCQGQRLHNIDVFPNRSTSIQEEKAARCDCSRKSYLLGLEERRSGRPGTTSLYSRVNQEIKQVEVAQRIGREANEATSKASPAIVLAEAAQGTNSKVGLPFPLDMWTY